MDLKTKNMMNEKRARLEETKAILKTEFFGMDDIIDNVIDSVYAWYVFPQILLRPVIINLWGMTGVGKTQLVRRITSLLGFSDRFVEIQMDGINNSTFGNETVSAILMDSTIDEGQQGILLLDEVQRYRTINEDGDMVDSQRYQDVWALLSDGKFAANSAVFKVLEETMAYEKMRRAEEESDDEVLTPKKKNTKKKITKKLQYNIFPYEAKMIKSVLKLEDTVYEIMTWDWRKIEDLYKELRSIKTDWEIDYTKLLIFISGNLDKAFTGANNVNDCDTDADIYHTWTKKLTSVDIKKALVDQFKPEQISRLGNTHIIYPSLSKNTYEKIIKNACEQYKTEMEKISNLKINLDHSIFDAIYKNSVYPTQGTRPVFSSIHKIFGASLIKVVVWALESNHKEVNLVINQSEQLLIAECNGDKTKVKIDLELDAKRARTSKEFNNIVAVHEAGHAVIYALLFNKAPMEVKINLATYTGGYTIPSNKTLTGNSKNEIFSKTEMLNSIMVLMAGTAAEEYVFGESNRVNGNQSDITNATILASDYIRVHGFGDTKAHINGETQADIQFVSDLGDSNFSIERLITTCYDEVMILLKDEKISHFLAVVVQELLKNTVINNNDFLKIAKQYIKCFELEEITYYNKVSRFLEVTLGHE